MYTPSSGNPAGHHPEKASWLLFRVQQWAAFLLPLSPMWWEAARVIFTSSYSVCTQGNLLEKPLVVSAQRLLKWVLQGRKLPVRGPSTPCPLWLQVWSGGAHADPPCPTIAPSPASGRAAAALLHTATVPFPLARGGGKKGQRAVIFCP